MHEILKLYMMIFVIYWSWWFLWRNLFLHIFIWHKWNKSHELKQLKREKVSPRKIYFSYFLIFFKKEFNQSIYITFMNLLDHENDFDELNLNDPLSKSFTYSWDLWIKIFYLLCFFLSFIKEKNYQNESWMFFRYSWIDYNLKDLLWINIFY